MTDAALPDPLATAAALEALAAAAGNPERAAKEASYLKLPHWRFHGASVPAIRKVAKTWLSDRPSLGRDALWSIVHALWGQTCWERRRLAAELLELRAGTLDADDMDRLEGLLRDSHTWALVDSLAVHAAGSIVRRHPATGAVLDRWSTDIDFWLRRSAMLALLIPLREGGGDWERFSRYADDMLDDPEFFIRKAIGWVARDTSRQRPELVAAWVAPRTHRLSGVSLREAIRRLPPEEQARLRQAYKERRPAQPH